MESLDIVKFGIFDDFSHVFGTGIITNVIPLNHREMIISTTKEIIKIEKSVIKMRQPIKFSTCAIVPGTDFLIGITIKKGDLVIYQIGDLPQKQQSYNSRSIELPPPLLDNYPTNQSGIFHMIYSSKSQAIITIGAGIKVFTLEYKLSRISVIKPTVSISNRSSFASDYATTILVPPAFDSDTELLLLPTNDGICAFNLDGQKVMLCSKFPASVSTVYATHPSKPPKIEEKNPKIVTMTKKILIYDSNKGMSLWGKKGQKIEEFNTIGSSVLAIMFVDSENALCLNSNHALFFLNIKTGKSFFCLNLEKNPTRLFLTFVNKEPFLCACFSSFMRVLKIVIPWRVWNLNVDKALLMNRCNKFRSAARVLISAENCFIKFYSPRDGGKMTVATPAEAARPVSFLYDRGIVERYIFDESALRYSVQVTRITNKTQTNEEKDKEKEKKEQTNEENKNEEEETAEKSGGRDILFILLENGTIIGFDTNVANCEEVMKIKGKAAFMSICRIRTTKKHHHKKETKKENEKEKETKKEEDKEKQDNNNNNEDDDDSNNYQWFYAVASPKSDLFILDYFTMKEVRHFTVSDDVLIKMFFHFESECIIMVFEKKTILFDIEKGKIIDTILVGGNEITTMFANFLIFGYESGHIRRLGIEKKKFVLCDDNKKKGSNNNNEEEEDENEGKKRIVSSRRIIDNSALQKPHSGRITGFSFSQRIWISSGLDGTIIVWDYNFEKVYKICLPLPLRACLIMNGKRDILVATETEVMQVKNNYLADFFEDDPYDVEIDDIDNFDKIKDALCHDTIEAFDPDAYENTITDDYSETEEEEEVKPKNNKKNSNMSNTAKNIANKLIDPTPKKSDEGESKAESEAKTSNKPPVNTEENVQKKLEMMQAMNGLGPSSSVGPPPVASSSSTSAAKKSSPKEEKPPPKKEEKPKEEAAKKPPKEVETKKKKPPKDGKALSDFINSNMEQEKAQSKRKKVKKTNNQENETKEEGPKKSEEEVANMIGNLFDRNRPKDAGNQNTKKKTGEGIDFNELAKKFHKDEDPIKVNLDKADLSKKGKGKGKGEEDGDEDGDDEGENDEKPQKTKQKETAKPKQSANSNSNSAPKTTTSSKPKEKEKENAKAATSSAPKTTAKPKEKEKAGASAKPSSKENDNKGAAAASDGKGKEKKPAKSSSSTKPQKEPAKSPAQPKETSNDAKAGSPAKKAKHPSPPKSTSKPASSTTANANSGSPGKAPATASASKPISSAANASGAPPKASYNESPSANANSSSSPAADSSAAPSSSTKPGTSSTSQPSAISKAESSPGSGAIQASGSRPDTIAGSNNANNGNAGGSQPSAASKSDGGSSNEGGGSAGKPGKVSIGTQGEDFGEDEKPGEEAAQEADDSMHLTVKMNGPDPTATQGDAASEGGSDPHEQEATVGKAVADEPHDEQQPHDANKQPEEAKAAEEAADDKLHNSDAECNDNDAGKLNDPAANDRNNSGNGGNDSGSDARNLRAPTPPPIRPQLSTPKSSGSGKPRAERKRSRTPPPKRERSISDFRMPPPNVIIDQEAVLVLYGRGRLEFKPLVDRIQRDMLMATKYNSDFYTQNKRITLALVQNLSETLQQEKEEEKEGDKGGSFARTQQPVAPPITPPRANSARVPFVMFADRDDRDDKSIFEGSVNSISPAFKNRQKKRPESGFFTVSVEKVGDSKSPRQPSLPRIADMHNAFSPAAYVYNYSNNTETVFNDLDTSSAVTTPRNSKTNESGEEEDEGDKSKNQDKEGDVTTHNSKSFEKSPRRIQSARTVGRPLISLSNTAGSSHDLQINMPYPLSPVVMASPRRSIMSKKRNFLVEPSSSSEEQISDQLESAVLTKMPRITFLPSPRGTSPQQPPNLNATVSPNFGQQSPATPQSLARRPNSVRTFDRSPLMFNQPIGVAMVKPGQPMKRNAAFYASVAVTTSISNARRSSPGYRTGAGRQKRPVKLSNRNNSSGQMEDVAGSFAKSSGNEIEITVE